MYDTAIDEVICSRILFPSRIWSLVSVHENPLNRIIKKGKEKGVNYKWFSDFGGTFFFYEWDVQSFKKTLLRTPRACIFPSMRGPPVHSLQRKNAMIGSFTVSWIPTNSVAQSLKFIIIIVCNDVGALLDINSQPLGTWKNSICLLSRKEICSLENFATWKKIFGIILQKWVCWMKLIFLPSFLLLGSCLATGLWGQVSSIP